MFLLCSQPPSSAYPTFLRRFLPMPARACAVRAWISRAAPPFGRTIPRISCRGPVEKRSSPCRVHVEDMSIRCGKMSSRCRGHVEPMSIQKNREALFSAGFRPAAPPSARKPATDCEGLLDNGRGRFHDLNSLFIKLRAFATVVCRSFADHRLPHIDRKF